jgi:protein-S-isoprenylcysteine O-methyltransferase Ste14
MFTLVLMFLGLFSFVAGTGILGIWLRKYPSQTNAEKTSRLMHFLFFAGLITPGIIGLFYPGSTHFDELLGLNPLPWKPFFLTLGITLALPGFYFLAISNKLLRALGSGANAFRLTKQVVLEDLDQRTRNPMSLGFYLLCVSTGFIAGSSFVTLGVLLGVIPAHLFFLKYFEELELELRFGESYLQYKRNIPFLIPKFTTHKRCINADDRPWSH